MCIFQKSLLQVVVEDISSNVWSHCWTTEAWHRISGKGCDWACKRWQRYAIKFLACKSILHSYYILISFFIFVWYIFMFLQGQLAYAYMAVFVNKMADHSPTQDRLLLPVGVTRAEIFKQYLCDTPEESQVKRSQFYGIWSSKMKNVSYPKVNLQTLLWFILTRLVFLLKLTNVATV